MSISKTNNPKSTIDMTNGPLLGPIVMYCLPIMVTGMLQLLFNAADIIVVGQFVNESAVAAVGACAPLINLIINLFVGVSLGATVVLASAIGGKRTEQYERIAQTTFTLGAIFGIITAAIGVIFARTFLEWMSTPSDFINEATLYLRIYFLGNPAFMIFTFGRALIVANGDTKTPLIYLSTAGVLNVVLNILFITVAGMGVEGVAIATVCSQILSAVLMTRALMRTTGPAHINLKKLYIDARSLVRIISLGLPVGVQNTLFSLSNVIIQSSVNALGTLCVAGNSACGNIDAFIYTAMNSFTQGCMTFAGQNYGAGKYERLNKVYGASLFCITTIGAGLSLLVYFNGPLLLSLYLPNSPEAISYGMIRMVFLVLPIFLCGLMDCGSGMLRGIGRSVFPMLATILGSCGLRILWVYSVFNEVFAKSDNIYSYKVLLFSYPLSWLTTFVVLLAYYFVVMRKLKSRGLNREIHDDKF